MAVTAIVEQAGLDAIRDGLRDGLAAGGHVAGRGLRFTFSSARADPQAATAIVRRFGEERASVIVAISTPSAEAALAAAPATPVVFVGTEPPHATTLPPPTLPANFTGLTMPPPAAPTLALMREFMPSLRRVGLLRAAASPRADAVEAGLRATTAPLGLDLAVRTLTPTEDGRAATEALAAQADAIVLVGDAAVLRVMPAIVAVAERQLRPLFTFDPELVARGAIAALEYDSYRVGLQLSGLVLRLLRGEAPPAIPTQPAAADRLTVNIDAAERTGTKVPPAVIERAQVIID